MTNLKTNESTLRALERAAKQPMTSDDLRKQRESFVMGTIKPTSATRAKVREEMAKQEGRGATR